MKRYFWKPLKGLNVKTVVIFSGAGLSADSGIPTFRGSDGLWENHKVEDVAEHEAWFRDRELVLRFYAERFNKYQSCKPHEGHYAIARLQEKFNVVNITQNIDNLLEQAGCNNVAHLHGMISRKKCEWHRNITSLDGDTRFQCDYEAPAESAVELGDLCPKCGGQMRPDVVWFGEAVHENHKELKKLVREVRLYDGYFICVGTSIQVYPAAYLIPLFSEVKNKYIVDPNPINVLNYELIRGTAKEQLPLLVDKIIST